jgi:ubiquinol-cytochrome c reductase cytochrome b subunit
VWYFTPYYAMLRAVPSFLGSQFWGVLVMGLAVVIFFALPWLDRGPSSRSAIAGRATRDGSRRSS